MALAGLALLLSVLSPRAVAKDAAQPSQVLPIRQIVAIALASRVAVLLVGYCAATTIGYDLKPLQYRLSHNELWNLPARWDAGWYLGIARQGYKWNPELAGRQQSVAFFPAYPALMRLGGEVVTAPAHILKDPSFLGNGNTRVTWGGVLVSIAAFVFALIQFYHLATLISRNGRTALAAVILLAAWPFALFFSAPYSESLFLLCSISATLELYRNRRGVSFLWGLLAGLTRPNGWALGASLLVLALRRGDRPIHTLVASSGPPLGTALFSLYIWHLSSDPLAWMHAQAGWGREFSAFGAITSRIALIRDIGVTRYVVTDPVDLLTVVSVVTSVVGIALAVRRFGWYLAAFPALYVLPALVLNLPATGRMTSVLFPAFIGIASTIPRTGCFIIAAVFAALQLWLSLRFFTWQTPF